MLTTALTIVQAFAGRALPVLIALQDAPHPAGGASSGGGAAGGGGASAGPGGLGQMMLPLLMLVMVGFLFLSGRKQRNEAANMQKSLQKGDKVVTTSGMIGTIAGIDEQFATLEIAEKVRVKFTRDAIARKVDAVTGAAASANKSDVKA